MNKFVLLLLTILLLPIMVYAEDKKVLLESIRLNEKSDNVVEISPATIEDNKIKLDFKMYEVDDYIEYKIKVKNNSKDTLEIDESKVVSSVKYVKYSVDSKSKIIKSGEEKDIILKITYTNKVDDGEFFSAKYTNINKIPLIFKTQSIINPKTIVLLAISLVIGYSVYNIKYKKSKKLLLVLLIAISMLIPFTVLATTEEIIIELSVTIGKVKPTHCTFGGELVPGAEYTNGQYTYRYRQEYLWDSWQNIDDDGWGVTLMDKNSTDPVTTPLCTTIDDKPLVSTSLMFEKAQTASIDTSSFDISNVIDMSAMFASCSSLTSLDLSSFDTSNVTGMIGMFANCSSLTIAYGKTQADCDRFNNSYRKPGNVNFVVKA